jgi:hypothetical protein
MFNPKGNNILDEQLAVSGLEMNIAGVLAGVSAVASIAGGIFGASEASKSNKRAESNYKAQVKAAKKQADRTNEYNKKVYNADLENYYNNREYEWETTLKNYQYNQSIQDYNYKKAVEQYAASVENTEKQLIYNSLAAKDAQESEQAALSEILSEDAFQQQGLLIESLQAEGRSALLQAGQSRTKAMQSQAAATGRDLSVMAASVKSARAQSARNMRDIALGKFIDDQNAMSAMMIRPDRLPDLPKPVQAPERIFVKPMKVDPAFISAPIKQSTFAPIVQGIGGAASTLMKADLGGAFD